MSQLMSKVDVNSNEPCHDDVDVYSTCFSTQKPFTITNISTAMTLNCDRHSNHHCYLLTGFMTLIRLSAFFSSSRWVSPNLLKTRLACARGSLTPMPENTSPKAGGVNRVDETITRWRYHVAQMIQKLNNRSTRSRRTTGLASVGTREIEECLEEALGLQCEVPIEDLRLF